MWLGVVPGEGPVVPEGEVPVVEVLDKEVPGGEGLDEVVPAVEEAVPAFEEVAVVVVVVQRNPDGVCEYWHLKGIHWYAHEEVEGVLVMLGASHAMHWLERDGQGVLFRPMGEEEVDVSASLWNALV